MITKHIKSFLEKRGFVLGGDLNKNDRAGALHRAWGHIFTNHIYGDYVEFGVYQGMFSETAPSLSERLSSKIAIINIDCDIYGSTVDALTAIRDRLQLGCVLMFDDYNAYCADNSQGERRAFHEFSTSTHFKFEPWFTYQYSGQAFLCVED